MILGILIGATAMAIAWRLNEMRWHWKITQEVHEYDDPDDQLLNRHRTTRRH